VARVTQLCLLFQSTIDRLGEEHIHLTGMFRDVSWF